MSELQKTALEITKILQQNGFIAYFVGGCVRDLILKKDPKDYDIATNAVPSEVEKIFPNTKIIGKKFGVVLISKNDFFFEVATFRSDGDYLDFRRPSSVTFSTPQKDAFRRDFTINGVFYDPIEQKHIDFVEGKKDLSRGLLRFIGDPDKRIEEDALRLLRAVRFKNRFRLTYEANTKKALKKHSSLVVEIAAERILDELHQIIAHHSRAKAFKDLFKLSVLSRVFPTVEKLRQTLQSPDHHAEGDALTHTFLVLQNIPEGEPLELYWAAFFHDFAKPFTKKKIDGIWRFPGHDQIVGEQIAPVLKKLKFSKKMQDRILWLLRYKPIFESFWEIKLSKRLAFYDHSDFKTLWKLEMADIKGCISVSKDSKKKILQEMNLIQENYEYAHQAEILPSYKREFLTGVEIMEHTKLPAGKIIGELKSQLREKQIEGIIKNRGEAKKWISQQI